MKKYTKWNVLALACLIACQLFACAPSRVSGETVSLSTQETYTETAATKAAVPETTETTTPEESSSESAAPETSVPAETETENAAAETASTYPASLTPAAFPAYSGSASIQYHNNQPLFTDAEFAFGPGTSFSELDSLGRCGTARGVITPATLPTEERGSIGMVKPSGWHTVKYNGIDGNYLYNRCHLIAYELSGVNAEPRNLITGTRYLNIEGMLPYENQTADYVEQTGNTVYYRVTPVFDGDNLVASGVLMEAASADDNGASYQFCVYCYNVQPGITINYADGTSEGPEFTGSENTTSAETAAPAESTTAAAGTADSSGSPAQDYVLNTNTKKFHYPTCSSVDDMKPKNRKDVHESRDQIIAEGYEPCKRCNP